MSWDLKTSSSYFGIHTHPASHVKYRTCCQNPLQHLHSTYLPAWKHLLKKTKQDEQMSWYAIIKAIVKRFVLTATFTNSKTNIKLVFKNHLDWDGPNMSSHIGRVWACNSMLLQLTNFIWILQNKTTQVAFEVDFKETAIQSAGGLVNKVSLHYHKSHEGITVCLHNLWSTFCCMLCVFRRKMEKNVHYS